MAQHSSFIWSSRSVPLAEDLEFAFSLPPGFSDDAALLLSPRQLSPRPSQNRAGAIYAHGSSHGNSPRFVHTDHYPWFRKRKQLQHFVELLPVEASPFSSAI